MNVIDTIFPFFLAVVCVISVLKAKGTFDHGIAIGLLGIAIGLPIGIGIGALCSAGILWLIIGILSFFGVTSVGAWTVGFSWTAVKVVMMIVFLINIIRKK